MRWRVWHTHSSTEIVKGDTVLQNRTQGTEPDHILRVYSDIIQLVANPQNPTPLVRLNRINTAKGFQIYLKLERYNPFGSIKDRIALEMLTALDIGDRTVVEPS